MLTSWLEMLFLSNFNISVEILVDSTSSLKFNEDKLNEDTTFFISVLSMQLKKDRSVFRKWEKGLREKEMLSFVLLAIVEKCLLKTFKIAIGSKIMVS